MRPKTTLRRAMADPQLLGGALAGDSWLSWRALLLAMMGEPLDVAETEVFRRLTGRETPPAKRVEECAVVAGRRGGKTRAMATLAVYIAGLCDHGRALARGERAVVLLIAPDLRQARVALDYALGVLESTPILRQLIVSRSVDTIALSTGIDIQVRSASFRRLRGLTAVAVLADEACFWHSDESANPDTEILNAARPTLATTGGPLIVISSPYARRGEVYGLWRRHFGPTGDPAILVAQGGSRDFNPSLPQSVVDRALERDPAAARAEYLGQWRDDVETFVSRDVVDACTSAGVFERQPLEGVEYFAFVDPSGGSSDSMTMGIAHLEGDVAVLDAVRERKPPFSPEEVVQDFAATLATFGLRRVEGDRYGGEWPPEAFRRSGITYETAGRSKSEIYRDALPALNSRAMDLLDHQILTAQLCGLERRTTRAGRDSIDHAPGGHDDVVNAAVGALLLALDDARIGGRAGFATFHTGYGAPPKLGYDPRLGPAAFANGKWHRAIAGPPKTLPTNGELK